MMHLAHSSVEVDVDDFRTWVLAVYPEVEEEIVGIPNSILEGIYSDVYRLGPALKTVEELVNAFVELYTEGGDGLIRTLAGRTAYFSLPHQNNVQFVATSVCPRVSAIQRAAISTELEARLGDDDDLNIENSSSLHTLVMASTLNRFSKRDGIAWRSQDAGRLVQSWAQVYSRHRGMRL